MLGQEHHFILEEISHIILILMPGNMNRNIIYLLISFNSCFLISCSDFKTPSASFKSAFNFELPNNAKNVHISRPTSIRKWNHNYLIVEWDFSSTDMERFLSQQRKDYSPWRKLTEFSVDGRFFTDRNMPDALMSDWREKDEIRILAADLRNGKIYACYWIN